MKRRVIFMPRRYIERQAELIRQNPKAFPGVAIRYSGSTISIEYPTMTILDKDLFKQKYHALGWLSKVKARLIKPLRILSHEKLRKHFGYVCAFPQGSDPSILRDLDGKLVLYLDIKSAYWNALCRVWQTVFNSPPPVEPVLSIGEPVDKTLRNMAWGSMGARVVIERIDRDGAITIENRFKNPPPVYFAVPWIVHSALRRALAGNPGFIWVDSVITDYETGLKALKTLQAEGWECHVIIGILHVNETLDIIDPESGEVIKSQAWSWLVPERERLTIQAK